MNGNVKLVGFDLDGTLTQHKTPIEPMNAKLLEAITRKYAAVLMAAGTCERVFRQLNRFPIDIVGNYGMQESTVEMKDGVARLRVIRDEKRPPDRDEVERRVQWIRELTGYTEIAGDPVEYHPSGVLTFPLLGTQAPLEEKLKFDPDRRKRRAIYELVVEAFPEYNVFIGGSSSFDIVPKPFEKYYALVAYARERGIQPNEIVYVGDDFGPGGNDEPVAKGGIRCINVDDYRALERYLADLI